MLAVFGLVAVSALLLSGGEPEILLNGQRLDGLDTLNTSSGIRVPLKEAGRLFGARVDPGREDGFIVEWGASDSFYVGEDDLTRSGDSQFIDLNLLVEKLEGEVVSSRGRLDVKIPPSRLITASSRPGEISLNFTKYTAFTRTRKEDDLLELKFHNADRGGVDEAIDLPPESNNIRSARLEGRDKGTLVLLLEHQEGVTPRVKTSRGESGFSFRIKFESVEGEEVTSGPPPAGSHDFSYNRLQLWSSGNSHTVHYLKVSRWRDNYRLLPVVANGELGRGDELSRLVRDNLGVAGLNANFFDPSTFYPIGLLVKDGKLLSKNWGNRAALGIDYFGRLQFFRPEVDLFLRNSGSKIEIDGLNRPSGEDELVAYTTEYGDDFPARNSSLFITIKDDELIRRSSTPPSSVSSNETLVVATGSARDRIRGLNQGDEIEYDWSMKPPVSLLKGAVSAGPLLIKDGKNALSLEEEDFTRSSGLVRSRTSRSVFATTGDGEILFMVISNGGIGLEGLPDLLLGAGLNIENAIAFDGGSSAGIIYRDGTSIRSVGGNRQVPVGLVLVSRS